MIDGEADVDGEVLGDSSGWSAEVLSVLSVLQAASATSSTEHPTSLATAPDRESGVTPAD